MTVTNKHVLRFGSQTRGPEAQRSRIGFRVQGGAKKPLKDQSPKPSTLNYSLAVQQATSKLSTKNITSPKTHRP